MTPTTSRERAPAIAIGIGCRKGCAGETIAALVRRAMEELGRDASEARARLFSTQKKSFEPGLAEAAAMLGLPLILLPQDALLAAAPRCETRSARVLALTGLPSVAEAAALAGAGEASLLVVKRISEGGVSCAVARAVEFLS